MVRIASEIREQVLTRIQRDGDSAFNTLIITLLIVDGTIIENPFYLALISEKADFSISTDIIRTPFQFSDVFYNLRKEVQRFDKLTMKIVPKLLKSTYESDNPSVPPTNSTVINEIYDAAGGAISLEEVAKKIGTAKGAVDVTVGKAKSAWGKVKGWFK